MALSRMHKFASAAIIPTLISLTGSLQAQGVDPNIPQFRTHGTTKQIYVDGKPFLMLGGEWGNSASASAELARTTWARMAQANMNTNFVAVSWELIEPEEGKFDFAAVDGLITDARAAGQKIVFLWFGSWKNGLSSYQPMWVKTDPKRFLWVKTAQGQSKDTLSVFGGEAAQADAKAFAALMKHIKEFDGTRHTVLMMQVENEVGVREQDRDFSPLANQAFDAPVPKELMDYLNARRGKLVPELNARLEKAGNKTAGTWTEVFGPKGASTSPYSNVDTFTEEAFQAWFYAKYVETVAAAGKKEYAIPMYANCWLDQNAGWPHGGPTSYLLDIWQAGAPSLDLLAPDLYAGNFEERCTLYHRQGNTLFIPETNAGSAAPNALDVYGKMDGMCISPFAVDRNNGAPAQSYLALSQLAPAILEYQGTGKIFGWLLGGGTINNRATDEGTVGNYKVGVKAAAAPAPAPAAGGGRGGGGAGTSSGMIITLAPDEFYILQANSTITFTPSDPAKGKLSVDLLEEGKFVNDKWVGQPVVVQNRELTPSITTSYKNYHVKLSQKP